MLHGAQDCGHVLFTHVQHGIGTSVKGIGSHRILSSLSSRTIQLLYDLHNGTRRVVHVKDRRSRVQAAGVEVVRVGHGDACKGAKVAGRNGFRHGTHSLRDHMTDAVLQQRRRLDRLLHAARGRRALLAIVHHTNQDVQVGPVFAIRHRHSKGVGAVVSRAHIPRDKAAKHGATSRATSTARNHRELRAREDAA